MVRGSARFDCYMSARRRVYSDLRLFAVSTYLELESGFDWLILLSRARNRLLYLQAADVYNTGLETLTFAVITFYSWINEQWESSCRRWENLKFKWSRSTPLLASLLRFRSTWIVTFQFFLVPIPVKFLFIAEKQVSLYKKLIQRLALLIFVYHTEYRFYWRTDFFFKCIVFARTVTMNNANNGGFTNILKLFILKCKSNSIVTKFYLFREI